MSLVKSGIFDEKCDLRVHVCVRAGVVYTYLPVFGIQAICEKRGRAAPVYSRVHGSMMLTADGRIVRPSDIRLCRVFYALPHIEAQGFRRTDNPSVKGEKAVNVVCEMLRRGELYYPVEPTVITDVKTQLSGIDLIAPPGIRFQVKCDYDGGEFGGTGNLYLQTMEANPLGYV